MNRLIVFFVSCLLSSIAMAFSYTLEITEQELQEKVSAMMPLEKKKFFVTVILSEPKVELLKETNEISIFSNLEALAPGGLKGSGRAKITGSLSYDANEGAFYLNNPKIESIEIDKMPEKYSPKIKQLTQTAVSKAMSVYSVYKLKDDNLKHKLAKATLESISVDGGKLLVVLSAF